jgi:hypothetical protein
MQREINCHLDKGKAAANVQSRKCKQKEKNQPTDRAMLQLFEGILNEIQFKR